MLDKIITEISSKAIAGELAKLKEADPQKYDETHKMLLTAVEAGIHFLRESPEFREAFARIHNEFLQYPESHSTIKQALKTIEGMK